MAQAWIYDGVRLPTTKSAFNMSSNLMVTNLGGGYVTRYNNGTAQYSQELTYEYDYLTLAQLNAFDAYMLSASDGRTIDLPDYSVDYSGATKIQVFIISYNKTLAESSTTHWTVSVSFRRVYE